MFVKHFDHDVDCLVAVTLANDYDLCYVDFMRKGIVCMSACNVKCNGMMMWVSPNGELRVMCNAGCVETDCQEQDCLLKKSISYHSCPRQCR